MSDPAVIVAIRTHLLAVPGLPTLYLPNQSVSGADTPYLTWDNGVTSNAPLYLRGREAFRLNPNVALHVEAGTNTNEGDAILWAIEQAFKYNTRIFSGSTEVAECLQTPVADNGEHRGGLFRRNMILRIASYQTI